MNHRLLWSRTGQRPPTTYRCCFMLLFALIATGVGPAVATGPEVLPCHRLQQKARATPFWCVGSQTELDVYNFILYRGIAPQAVEPFVTICTLSPQGSNISGATYTCTDDKPGLTAGHASTGSTSSTRTANLPSIRQAPIQPIFQGTPTVTPTVPADATNTPTATLTSTSEFTATPTPSPA